jgi:hypothetical protein
MMLPGTGRVQIDERGTAGRVAHAFHQLARVGARFSDELIPRLAQVVQVNVGAGRGEVRTPDRFRLTGRGECHRLSRRSSRFYCPAPSSPVSRVIHKESIQVFLFFSNRIGCLGSLVVSAILTLILLAAFHVL